MIETAGSAKVLETAYLATRRGGVTVTVGLPNPAALLSIPAVSLVAEERTLKGSYLGSANPSEMLPQLFDYWRAGKLPVEKLISGRLKLDQINEGFDRLASGEAIRQIIVLGSGEGNKTRGRKHSRTVAALIGETGFEPATARPPAGCATRLRHSPWPFNCKPSGRRESNPP